jgi:energy-coupling factor transport system permease protein
MLPLKKMKFPAEEVAMMMTIAIRFIPVLLVEIDRIMKAQKSRMANFDEGNLLKRAKALISIFIPLLARSFETSDNLALAMEARCYGGDIKRTKYRMLKFTKIDFIAGIIFVIYLAGLILLRIY